MDRHLLSCYTVTRHNLSHITKLSIYPWIWISPLLSAGVSSQHITIYLSIYHHYPELTTCLKGYHIYLAGYHINDATPPIHRDIIHKYLYRAITTLCTGLVVTYTTYQTHPLVVESRDSCLQNTLSSRFQFKQATLQRNPAAKTANGQGEVKSGRVR